MTTIDPRLDRIYESDWRSLNFLVGPYRLSDGAWRKPRSYTYALSQWLDQLQEGACVWFSLGHELAAKPVPVIGITDQYCREKYWLTQQEDPWPGGAYPGADPYYEGTSVLSGVKVAQRLGYYLGYRWALDARQTAEGLGYDGPCVLGIPWKTGMYEVDANGWVHAVGQTVGGHAICAIGVRIVWKSWINRYISSNWENVDFDKSYVLLHNSWGPTWGANGRAKLSLRDLDVLLTENGEAVFPKRNSLVKVVV